MNNSIDHENSSALMPVKYQHIEIYSLFNDNFVYKSNQNDCEDICFTEDDTSLNDSDA